MSYADIAGTEIKRRNIGGIAMSHDVSDGPMRWERARLWAEAHPNTKAAELYRERRAAAATIMAALPDHLRTSFMFSREVYGKTRRTYMCSLECAAMRAQLDAPEATVNTFKAAVAGMLAFTPPHAHMITALDRTTLERAVKCRVCGERMLPQADADRAALDDVAAQLDSQVRVLTDKYVLVNGHFVPLSTVRVVELTLEQHHMLERYSTDELRGQYSANCGYPLTEA